ncbi:MAG: response regulator transcription factor [Candidatus Glassbacteria bacterium]|nr:response regulator transcription factor [Candidatus Glassbacteria bacterium]
MKVLIADDSEIMCEHLTDALTGYSDIEIVGRAGDGRQAVESIRKLEPDVVILDIRMQNGNGIEVLEQVKKDKLPPVVIMFTNYPFPQYRKKCAEAGADFFFDKSSESHKVIETLETLAGKFKRPGGKETGAKKLTE